MRMRINVTIKFTHTMHRDVTNALLSQSYLEYHVARIVHPKIFWRVSWFAELYG